MELKKLIKDKKYEEIYQKYGREIYCLFTPIGYKHDDIINLLNQKNYLEIEKKYTKFDSFTIKKFRVYYSDKLKKLKKEGNFFELNEAYFIDNEIMAIGRDVYLETGSKLKVIRHKAPLIAKKIGNEAALLALSVSIGVVLITTPYYINQNHKIRENEKSMKSAILESDEEINNYVLKLQEENLTDLEVIMSVMNYVDTTMRGYGKPNIEIDGFYRIALLDSDSTGVCRNIADKCTTIFNRYKDWEAYNLAVYMDDDKYTKESFNNIKLNVVYRPNLPDRNNQEIDEKNKEANHLVTLLKIPNLKYPLIIDATNPSIGVLVEGKVFMLSNENGEGLYYRVGKEFAIGPTKQFDSVNYEVLKSLFVPFDENDLKEMIQLFGIDAQNEALNSVLLKDFESGKSLK